MKIDLRKVRHELECAQGEAHDQATQHLINALEILVMALEADTMKPGTSGAGLIGRLRT